jgi:hypothetical protein
MSSFCKFSGDDRQYVLITKSDQYHKYVKCLATRETEAGVEHCVFEKRQDHFSKDHKEGKSHPCVFQRPRPDIRQMLTHPTDATSPLLEALVQFVAHNNISLEAGSSKELRALMEACFRAGFAACLADPKSDPDEKWRRMCPPINSTALRRRIVSSAGCIRKIRYDGYAKVPFCALTMDGGQIRTTKLFFTNIIAPPPHKERGACTNSIEIVGAMNHETLSETVVKNINELQVKGINISAITCDGASYQVTALNFEDPDSIQRKNFETEHLRKLLFVPCLCHRLNNAYRSLFRTSDLFKATITSLRDLGVVCRKPANCITLGAFCPTFIQTRWIYDQRILDFILKHEEKITEFADIPWRYEFHQFQELIDRFFAIVTTLEGQHVPLALAYPSISAVISRFQEIGSTHDDAIVADVYRLAAEKIRTCSLESTHGLFHLAYVLTPDGRKKARAQLLANVESGEYGAEGDHQVDLEFFDVPIDLEREDEDIASLEENDLSEKGFLNVDDVPAPQGDEETPETIDPDVVQVTADNSSWDSLPQQARSGLKRIATQFDMSPEEVSQLMSAFDNYLEVSERVLELTVREGGGEYVWMSTVGQNRRYAPLANIALRLEPASCSEAPSERSIGECRRILLPHRARMKPDILLALSDFGDVL